MDELNHLLNELCICVDKCEHNESHIKFTFADRKMFIKYILYVTNCKMSDDLSKNIHTVWIIELLTHGGNIRNIMDIINNFSEQELDKIIESENKEYYVIFPFGILPNIINQLTNEYEYEYDDEYDSCFMVCSNPNYDLSDDLIYSDDDI